MKSSMFSWGETAETSLNCRKFERKLSNENHQSKLNARRLPPLGSNGACGVFMLLFPNNSLVRSWFTAWRGPQRSQATGLHLPQ